MVATTNLGGVKSGDIAKPRGLNSGLDVDDLETEDIAKKPNGWTGPNAPTSRLGPRLHHQKTDALDDSRYHGWEGNPTTTPDPEDRWTHSSGIAKAKGDHWQGPTSRLAPSDGWIEEDVIDQESQDYQSDEWIQDALESYGEDGETQFVTEYPRVQSLAPVTWQLMLVVAAGILLLSVFALKFNSEAGVPNEQQTQNVNSESLDSAKIWMQSAQESFRKQDYKLASAQFEKGIHFLREGEAPESDILKAKVQLAQAQKSQGDPVAALKTLKGIGNEDARQEIKILQKDLRLNAISLQQQAQQSLGSNKARQAFRYAQESSDIFDRYGGQAKQRALSYELMAQAQRARKNSIMALSLFKKSHALEPTEARKRAIRELQPKPMEKSPLKKTKFRPKKPPSVGEASNVPLGVRIRESHGEKDSTQAESPEGPKQAPPESVRPVEQGPSDPEDNLGNEDVLEGYAHPPKPTSVY